MSQAVGIDLGTTYSAVAVLRATGKSEILNNQDGDPITPSVVLFQNWGDGDEPLVGVQAKNLAAATPMDVAQFVKRHMGDPDWRFDSSSGNSYTAEEVTAIILKRLKQDAELALGEPITDVVITVPAYFDDARRTATKQAGKIAGLNVLRVLNEPTAAALSYGLGADRGGTVLVYDLGGGTFDVTLLRIDGAEFDVIATDGDRNLGGFDFDNALIQFIAEKMQAQGAQNVLESVEATAALREKAEQAKRSLTSVNNTNVHLSFEGRQYRVPVTRDDFVEVTRSLVNRTKEIVEDVLTEARTTWDQVDRVLLVGGSTRMPMIRDMVQQLSGKTAELDINPDEAVALGAAIQAAVELTSSGGTAAVPGLKAGLLGGATLKISDVTSQALGVITVTGPNNEVEVNSVVIPRNAKVPSKHSLDLQTIYENQTLLRVQVTQGDDPDPAFVTVVGESELKMPPYPAGSPLRVTYHYDVDQTIFVEVDDLVTNRSLGTFEIDRRANLKDDDVQKAAVRIAKVEVS